jgi:hypothetical protein
MRKNATMVPALMAETMVVFHPAERPISSPMFGRICESAKKSYPSKNEATLRSTRRRF